MGYVPPSTSQWPRGLGLWMQSRRPPSSDMALEKMRYDDSLKRRENKLANGDKEGKNHDQVPSITVSVPAIAGDAIAATDVVMTTLSMPPALIAESSMPTVPLTAGWIYEAS